MPAERHATICGRPPDERGVALILALLTMMLMLALGSALILMTSTETHISTNFRNDSEGLYAADAALERAAADVLTELDWNQLLSGAAQSAFVDGAATGMRTLPNGTTVDLSQIVNLANCRKTTSCSIAEMNAITSERPWGANNPRWQLYAYGPLNGLLAGGTVDSAFYAIVMVADDSSETDSDPLHDGVTGCQGALPVADNGNPPRWSCNPGTGVIALRAEAFGPHGAHTVVEMTLARTDTTDLERGYTGQRGQDEQGRRARKAAVQTPGKALTQMEMTVGDDGFSVKR